MVELALLLPFLALIVFGTIDLGRAYALKNRLTNMAREGAYYGRGQPGRISCPPNENSISQRAKAEDSGLAPSTTITVQWYLADGTTTAAMPATTCASGVGTSGYQLRVDATAPLQLLTPVAANIVGNPVTVRGYEQMVMIL